MIEEKDFQKYTAQRIFELFTNEEEPRNRVLLSDEVGLGKTIVAKKVIDLMRHWAPAVEDNFFKVVYICSNINIAKQNTEKLEVKRTLDPSESRLSMQHYHILKKELELTTEANKTGEVPEEIIPITPSTSFNLSGRGGTVYERALICEIIRVRPEFNGLEAQLSEYMKLGATSGWNRAVDRYCRGIKQDLPKNYRQRINRILSEKYQEIIDSLLEDLTARSNVLENVRDLRTAFAEISIDMLNPDLVIMDEFQRYRDLISGEDTEQNMLVKRFLGANSSTKVLLLSATPYKPYSTLEEINESGSDEHFREFLRVTTFLNGGKNEKEKDFEQKWSKYGLALKHISSGGIDELKVAKSDAEEALYGLMCRTERFNAGIIEEVKTDVSISADDAVSYFQSRRLLDKTNSEAPRKRFNRVPVEYVKSAPYLMSFMDRYEMKNHVEQYGKSVLRRSFWSNQYLPYEKIHELKYLKCCNARLESLRHIMLGNVEQSKYLWIPASKPYYTTDGVYRNSKNFSKVLLFSSWQMVPRMISVMMSYYAEVAVVSEFRKKGFQAGRYFADKGSRKYDRQGRLSTFKENANPLNYPCLYLAKLYRPEEWFGKHVTEIKAELKSRIDEWLKKFSADAGIPFGGRLKDDYILPLMQAMDKKDVSEVLPHIPDGIAEILVDAAMASPAVCLLRTLGDERAAEAAKISKIFVSLFNKTESNTIVYACYPDIENYVSGVLRYCVEGNLQAVLDEYNYMLGGKWSDELLDNVIIGSQTLDVEMQKEDKEIVKKPLRTWYARSFINQKTDEKSVNSTKALMTAFNSPFRPFILSTTSIGQEGLDFHWYSRKLVHWNLPTNPVDLEQREGRINRYKCLAIRQSLAQHYGDCFDWNQIFNKAAEDYKSGYSDMVPCWCLPKEFPEEDRVHIERILMQFPLSNDVSRYRRLKKVLALYRLTLGQPRQEELLETLSCSGLTPEEMQALMINLSPFDKEREKE